MLHVQGELTEGIEELKMEVDKATVEQDEAPYQSKLVLVKLVVCPEGEDQPQGAQAGSQLSCDDFGGQDSQGPRPDSSTIR